MQRARTFISARIINKGGSRRPVIGRMIAFDGTRRSKRRLRIEWKVNRQFRTLVFFIRRVCWISGSERRINKDRILIESTNIILKVLLTVYSKNCGLLFLNQILITWHRKPYRMNFSVFIIMAEPDEGVKRAPHAVYTLSTSLSRDARTVRSRRFGMAHRNENSGDLVLELGTKWT